jgi:hypothetical protein
MLSSEVQDSWKRLDYGMLDETMYFEIVLYLAKKTYILDETYSKSCQLRYLPDYKSIAEVPIPRSDSITRKRSVPGLSCWKR